MLQVTGLEEHHSAFTVTQIMFGVCSRLLPARLQTRLFCSNAKTIAVPTTAVAKSPASELTRHLRIQIKMRGPMSIADYMRQCLTDPKHGYYMTRDVFGASGDFVTSPEISQVFGELLGIWCASQWMQLGKPDKVHIVEYGPGRGTLMSDLLRGAGVLAPFVRSADVSLIETSPHLRSVQRRTLLGQEVKGSQDAHHVVTQSGVNVHWRNSLDEVPRDGPVLIVANEFLDALPVHKFQRVADGWREVLVDVDEDSGPHHFKYVLSPSPTTWANTLLINSPYYKEQLSQVPVGHGIEVCPLAISHCQKIATRVAQSQGSALLIDYGQNAFAEDTFMAIKQHKQHHPLYMPGTCDLTAFVDFSVLSRGTADTCPSYGPVTQSALLHALGIQQRMEALARKAPSAEVARQHHQSYVRLTAPDQMGEKYMAWALSSVPVAGL